MHESCILIHMRTTLNINDDLLKQAARLSGITEKTAVVHAGLEALVARESAKRLAALGSEPRLRKIRRRRPQASMASR
jgi:Arc/MetJ family transcription regulator